MNEIWKDIPSYEGYYQVSDLGNFRSLPRVIGYKHGGVRNYPGKPLLTETTKDNYRRIVLMKGGGTGTGIRPIDLLLLPSYPIQKINLLLIIKMVIRVII